jgi:iron complex outermembrane receptor protein
VQNYELGLKTQWLDRRLTINLSAFRADYQNYQVQSTQVGAAGQTPSIRLYAVGKVRSQGIELSSSLRASRLLRLGLDASYLDAKILEYPGAQCYIGQAAADGCANGVQNRRGVLPGTAKFRAVASANQTIPLSSLPFDGTLGALFRYQTRVQFDLLGSPNTIQGSYGVLNLTAGIRDRSGKYTAEFFVNNVTNQHSYASLAQDPLAPAVAIVGIPTRDSYRYFGGRFGLHF